MRVIRKKSGQNAAKKSPLRIEPRRKQARGKDEPALPVAELENLLRQIVDSLSKEHPAPVVNVPKPVFNVPAPVVNIKPPVVNMPEPAKKWEFTGQKKDGVWHITAERTE